jgi:excisionase family DNA binding protein
MGSRAAKSAPAPTVPAASGVGDGSALAMALAELVRVVREEARAAVREELAAERARQAGPVAEEWLSTSDVAKRLGRAEKTVRYWIQARGLPARKHLGVWRVRRADLDAFIDGSGEAPERSRAAAILAELHGP